MATEPQHEPQPDPTVASELHKMAGLASADLRAAALAGHEDASRCTEHDVATLAGFRRWATPLRYLGDIYVPKKGFKRVRPGGFEVLRSPDGTFEIAVAQGTYATGNPDRMPSTKIERGPLTGQAVSLNRGQIRLDTNIVSISGEPLPTASGPLTWILLHYFDERANELRVELSLPVEFTPKSGTDNERGAVTAFEPRLCLPPIPLNDQIEDQDDDEGDDEIDIAVERRR